MSAAQRIVRVAAISVAIAVAAVVLPRFAATSEGGLAAAATAALVFLGLLAVAAAFAAVGLVASIRAWRSLSWAVRLAGVGPAVVLGGTLAWLIVSLRY